MKEQVFTEVAKKVSETYQDLRKEIRKEFKNKLPIMVVKRRGHD